MLHSQMLTHEAVNLFLSYLKPSVTGFITAAAESYQRFCRYE